MKYLYARVSTKEQNLARQLEIAEQYSCDRIFSDKKSGKDMNRPEYQTLKGILQPGDEVIIKELDRLGRNKELVKEEIKWFKEHGVTLRILNIPTTMIDFQGQDWIQDMISNILIEVMASFAEEEREKITRRREEGIAAMPVVNGKRVSAKTGKTYGRQRKTTDRFDEYFARQKAGEITVETALAELGICRATWYARVKEHNTI